MYKLPIYYRSILSALLVTCWVAVVSCLAVAGRWSLTVCWTCRGGWGRRAPRPGRRRTAAGTGAPSSYTPPSKTTNQSSSKMLRHISAKLLNSTTLLSLAFLQIWTIKQPEVQLASSRWIFTNCRKYQVWSASRTVGLLSGRSPAVMACLTRSNGLQHQPKRWKKK